MIDSAIRDFANKFEIGAAFSAIKMLKNTGEVFIQKAGEEVPKVFTFDSVYDWNSEQRDISAETAYPVVENVIQGYNGTVFAYGQTGSGKTYTLTGGVDAFADRGIVPRAISRIFAHCAASTGEVEHVIRISYLEIYNEVGYDLLGAVPTGGAAAGEGFTLPRISAVAEDEDGGARLLARRRPRRELLGDVHAVLVLLLREAARRRPRGYRPGQPRRRRHRVTPWRNPQGQSTSRPSGCPTPPTTRRSRRPSAN